MGKSNGVTIYNGPSRYDGKPIIVVATGLDRPSFNRKTGAMIQTWIMPRDVAPVESIKTGADASACGDCALRGVLGVKRKCYVNVGQAPRSIWEAFHAGKYSEALSDRERSAVFRGASLRCGAWGDPGATPTAVWRSALRDTRMHTGYTAAWRRRPSLRPYLMASVHSESEYHEARAAGWRTFRAGAEPLPGEILCPNTATGVQCRDCGLCDGVARLGDQRAPIHVPPHGPGAVHFEDPCVPKVEGAP